MSSANITSRLEGYDRQLFPATLDALNHAYDCAENRGATLEMVGRTIPGYRGIDRPTTSDGYEWFWGMHIATQEGIVGILFPWSQDWDRADGLCLDRSIAIHARGNVRQRDVDDIVDRLLDGIPKQKRQFPHRMASRRY